MKRAIEIERLQELWQHYERDLERVTAESGAMLSACKATYARLAYAHDRAERGRIRIKKCLQAIEKMRGE